MTVAEAVILATVFFDRAIDAVSYACCAPGLGISAGVLGAGDGAKGSHSSKEAPRAESVSDKRSWFRVVSPLEC